MIPDAPGKQNCPTSKKFHWVTEFATASTTAPFLPPKRIYGKRRFTDPEGNSNEHGIHVGNLDPTRGYIVGKSKSAAIFLWEPIDESNFIDGKLPLQVCVDVFPTQWLEQEYCQAELFSKESRQRRL